MTELSVCMSQELRLRFISTLGKEANKNNINLAIHCTPFLNIANYVDTLTELLCRPSKGV